MMVTNDLSSGRKLRKVKKKRFYVQKYEKKTESLKMTLKVVQELLIGSYGRFMYFSPTWDNCQNYERQPAKILTKIEFQARKDQKYNTSKNGLKTPL